MLDIAFSDASLPASGTIAILAASGGAPAGALAALDAAVGGALTRAAKATGFGFDAAKTCVVLAPGAGYDRVVLVGLGALDALDGAVAEQAGVAAARALSDAGTSGVVVADGIAPDLAAHVALGVVLGSYRFDSYRTRPRKGDAGPLAAVTVACADPAAAQAAWQPLSAVARGVFLCRDLVSEPANMLRPPEFEQRILALRDLGVEVEVLDRDAMHKLGFGALLGVAQGSDAPPRTVIMRWNGGTDGAAPVAFVGKGVTFDSGGISIKPAAGMDEMKTDMAGAAAVVGTMAALAGRKAKVNAVGVVGLVENMLSGNAQRPGDVVRTAAGQTVEVLNTDAEGRLVLADVLWYTQDRFKPRFMVNLATLTGAIVVSLGVERAGLFSNNDGLAGHLSATGEQTGEKLWRMPMDASYLELLRSDIADLKNIGGRPGGSITAAKFLECFVNDVPWAHLDIAGTAFTSKATSHAPRGATGFGVRLLDRMVGTYYEG
ncbi:leucyl aminopeptidase [Komagataeibacter intermedius]|uniref:Probable cytosol aminopeptidase n=2 Tax=Komagataeibacter intermedius TaxID=66229 RepID=A0A0N0MGQ2_9PROT|nr:leucyl aminopeptidase [Komagataeibacter intermedius]KPH89016.1 aminopeptidase A [Komagataeibacter intermedius AF2]MCF3635083.1 leucyl aminopeptidase [Komagataeibacter intermedius]GBQ66113.1 leucyl/cytosol aminopeptidase [Komagataeibacter intermedius NRIC 0521]